MAIRTYRCEYCKTTTPHETEKINHVLHLLLTLITCGLWIPVWLLLAILAGCVWRCKICGYQD